MERIISESVSSKLDDMSSRHCETNSMFAAPAALSASLRTWISVCRTKVEIAWMMVPTIGSLSAISRRSFFPRSPFNARWNSSSSDPPCCLRPVQPRISKSGARLGAMVRDPCKRTHKRQDVSTPARRRRVGVECKRHFCRLVQPGERLRSGVDVVVIRRPGEADEFRDDFRGPRRD